MKRKHYYVVGVIAFVIVGIVALYFMYRRTPESVLEEVTREVFEISIEEANPQIFSFEEQWYPNGDGECKIGFRFDTSETFFRNFEKLPIREKVGTSIPKYIKNSTNGYYLLHVVTWDHYLGQNFPWDFYLLIFDCTTQTGYLYYEFI